MVLAVKFIKLFFTLFSENRITQASAALSYYLTMTFFPLLIITYSFLGESYARTEQLLELAEWLLSEEVIAFIRDFFLYVDSGDRSIMLPVGLSVLLAYASSGLRCVQSTIGSIQGGTEHKGLGAFLFSFVYCLALLALVYFAVILMLSGPELIERIIGLFPNSTKIAELIPIPYIFLTLILFLFLLGLYHVPKRRQDKYRVLPGATVSSIAVLLMSPMFSFVINRSIKYSLVYGAIASVILLMLWIYMCCVLIYSGAILNVTLYAMKNK